MCTRFCKRALSLLLAICMVLSTLTVAVFAESASWTPADNTKIFVDSDAEDYFEDLRYEAVFFQGEYEENFGRSLNVARGPVSRAGSNDMILTYGEDIPAGGFTISVSDNCLIIAASDDEGMFYGYHAVIEQLLTTDMVVDTEMIPGEEVAVDLSALEDAVAKASNVEARKAKIVGIYYEDYMALIREAQTYYLFESDFTQEQVDTMTNAIMTLYNDLMAGTYDSATMLKNLPNLFAKYENLRALNMINPVPFEGWFLYNSAVVRAKNLVATNAYDQESVDAAIAEIDYLDDAIEFGLFFGVTEAGMDRADIINSAGFQTKTAYGGRTVRLAVNTIREFDVVNLLIVDENGLEVPAKITVAPVNRRAPDEKTLYADIVLDLEPGTYTFTVYAYQGNTALVCGDPVQCTITVK